MRVAIGLILLCALAGIAGAQKQPSKQYDVEYNAGIDAFRLGKYADARTHLEAAKAIDPSLPGAWRWLAALEQHDGNFGACVADAREAVRLNPTSSTVGDTRKLHDDCRKQWGKLDFDTSTLAAGQGALSVTADQTGATVEVNGLQYGATPLPGPRPIVAGDVDVKVSKDGYLPGEVKTTVVDGLVTDVEFVLEVDPNAHHDEIVAPAEADIGWVKVVSGVPSIVVTIDGKPAQLDTQGRYEIQSGSHEVEISAPGHEPMVQKVRVTKGQMLTVEAPLRAAEGLAKMRKKGGWAVAGGAVFLAVGAASAMISLDAADQARDEWVIETTRTTAIPLDESATYEPVHTRADIDALDSRSKTFAIVSDASYVVAAVAIAVGAYYLVKARPSVEVRW